MQFLLLVVDWLRPAGLEIYYCLAIILSDLITERLEFCKSEAFVSLGLFSFVVASVGLRVIRLFLSSFVGGAVLLNIFLLSQVRCSLEFMGCGIRTYLQ